MELDGIIRRAPAILVRLALEHCVTLEGARRIFYAEGRGLRRRDVMRAAARRIAELEGNQAKSPKPRLIVTGKTVETESLIEKPTPRIVEAVGRARRHPGW